MGENCLWCEQVEGTEECPRCKGRVCKAHMGPENCFRCLSFLLWEDPVTPQEIEAAKLPLATTFDGGYPVSAEDYSLYVQGRAATRMVKWLDMWSWMSAGWKTPDPFPLNWSAGTHGVCV